MRSSPLFSVMATHDVAAVDGRRGRCVPSVSSVVLP